MCAVTSAVFPDNSDTLEICSNPPQERKEGRFKKRWFLLTLNEPEKYEKLKEYLTGRRSFRYLYASKEEAETGHAHIHVFVEFTQSITLTTKGLQGANVAVKRKEGVIWTKNGAYDYVSKEGEKFDEAGTQSHQGSKTVGELLQIKDPRELDWKMYNAWYKARNWNCAVTVEDIEAFGEREVFYYWGETAAGKTKKFKDQYRHTGILFDNLTYNRHGFFEHMSEDPSVRIAFLDDFRDSTMPFIEFLAFCDYTRKSHNIKGGHILDHYDKVYITSTQDPETLYSGMRNQEDVRQIIRRMKITHLVTPFN